MLQIQCIQSKTQEANTLFSRFAIGPLRKGQGITVGNALRRVLLSNIQGLGNGGSLLTTGSSVEINVSGSYRTA